MAQQGLNIENGKLSVEDVIGRLKSMRPNIVLPDFDESRKHDPYYCVEWGMKKGQWFEQNVMDRYIDELSKKL